MRIGEGGADYLTLNCSKDLTNKKAVASPRRLTFQFASSNFSGPAAPQGRPSAAAEDDVHVGPDAAAGAGVPAQRVHLAAAPLRARRVARPDRDADQDLVPEQARQGQEDREGAHGPSEQVG